MKRPLAISVFLSVVGFQIVPADRGIATEQFAQYSIRNLSPAAKAAAPPQASDNKGNSLMECVTESCKINCSPKVASRFRPKWCAKFLQPS
jgi:hypothetical protein